jgi:hypothetical protein
MIIPSVASASWWNPFSWDIFQKKDSQTQVLENRIKELEKKLGTSTANSDALKEKEKITPSVIATPEKTKVISPTANNQTTVKPKTTVAPLVNNTQIPVVRNLEVEYKEIVNNYNKLREDILVIGKNNSSVSDIWTRANSDRENLLMEVNLPKTVKYIDYYKQRYSQMRSIFDKEFPPLMLQSILENKKIDEQQAQIDAKNSIEQERIENLKNVNMKLAELRGYKQQVQLMKSNNNFRDDIATLLPKITDLNGHKIFTNENTPYYNPWYLTEYVNKIYTIIQKQITQLEILQAQYQ